jgi:DNA repair ATPase RecN
MPLAPFEPARIQLVEPRSSAYRQKLDLDPPELARVEERGGDPRVARIACPEAPSDLPCKTKRSSQRSPRRRTAGAAGRAAATDGLAAVAYELTKKRRSAHELEGRVTHAMQELAMKGGF